MKAYTCIIWDWNGTLVDDVGTSLRSVNDMLSRRKLPEINMEQYYSYLDTPISRFYEHILDLSRESMDTITREFNEGYKKYFPALHSGAEALLARLQRAGKRQVILTSGNNQVIGRDITHFGIREFFSEIMGAEDLLAMGKVKRGVAWIGKQNVQPREMVMIGDTLHDYETAKAMGVDCILCAFGHQSEADLSTAGVPVVKSFSELTELLFPDEK